MQDESFKIYKYSWFKGRGGIAEKVNMLTLPRIALAFPIQRCEGKHQV